MVGLKREGKIRHLGLSNFGPEQLEEAFRLSDESAADQLAYNLLSRAIELEILPPGRDHVLGIIAYSPLMQGILSGNHASIDEIPDSRTRTRHFRGNRPRSRHGEEGAELALDGATMGRLNEVTAELMAKLGPSPDYYSATEKSRSW